MEQLIIEQPCMHSFLSPVLIMKIVPKITSFYTENMPNFMILDDRHLTP